MKTKDELFDELWRGAEAARKTALQQALCDPSAWAEQVAVLVMAIAKMTAVSLAVALCFRFLGVPDDAARMSGAFVVLLVVPFNPRRFFWRVVALERADFAFDRFIQVRRENR